MEILALATTAVNADVDFVVAIPEPSTAELVSPYMLGVLDAERGELCTPEMYFTRHGQMAEYAEGYESVAGETLLSQQLLGKESQPIVLVSSAVAYAQGKADYASGIYWPGSIEASVLDAYLMGWNDAYAAANNVNLSR